MTGEQTPEAESPPAFGEILINPQAETAENKKEDRVSPAKPQRKKNKAKKAGSKKKLLCCLALILLLPAALFLSYLAAVTYLLPYYIQEQLTAQYSQQLNRPVTVTQAQFAPFSFDLHLAGIHIGPERSRKNNNEPALCRIATIDTRLRPEALLDGKLIFENVQIKGMQAEITRRADGSFTDIGLSGKEGLGKTTQSLLPRWFSSWLQVDGLSLTESMLVLRDATSGHEYHLDEIAFSLPSAAKQQDAQTPVLPTLHALVNGNPVQIRGERHIRQDNSSVTRLRLQLDDIDPQQLIDWLPNMGNLLHITTEKTTASLELILPDSPPAHLQGNEAKETKEEIRLSGKVSFT
ncbi:MAG: AsmA family protein, partial [Candidatus Electrothrix sp. AS4_5]|nr:AsmA family protein [Candidatus Electrothrix gigas]